MTGFSFPETNPSSEIQCAPVLDLQGEDDTPLGKSPHSHTYKCVYSLLWQALPQVQGDISVPVLRGQHWSG